MRVDNIKSTIAFANRTNGMTIPTDIDKMVRTSNNNNYSPVFGGYGFKSVAVPICDTFVHVFK